MNTRVIAPVIAALAVATLAGCGSSGDAATTAASVVTVTRTVAPSTTAPTPAATETTTVEETTEVTTDEAGDTTATPVRSTPTGQQGTGVSAYVGRYQRHESLMTLDADQTGDINEGASAADGEEWATTWRPTGEGITITYQRKLKQYGKGLEAGLRPGLSFSAHFTTSTVGKPLLFTSPVGTEISAVGWCRSTPDGYSPECGA